MKRIISCLLLLGLCWTGPSLAEKKATNPHHLSANSCASSRCHDEVYQQWEASRHAKASPLANFLVGEMYRELGADPLAENATMDGQYPLCLNCHAPNAAKDHKTRLDQHNYAEGVNCLICHTLERFEGTTDAAGQPKVGIDAYAISPTNLQSPSGRYLDADADANHALPMAPNQWNLRTSRVCLGCHTNFDSQAGVNLCRTGVEYQDLGNPVTCQSCHMPKTEYSTDHSMRGGSSETMVNRALVMTLDAARGEGNEWKLRVRVENMLPHGFPAGSPLRVAYLRLSLYDRQDRVVWSNFSSFPVNPQDSPESVFQLRLDNPLLPFRATKIESDTRFKAREAREIQYTARAKEPVMMRGEIYYRQIHWALHEKYEDQLSGDITSPIVAAIAEKRL